MNRREFFKMTGMATTAAVASTTMQGSLSEEAVAQTNVASSQSGRDFKVIDWRCRPPLRPYKGLFDLRLTGIANRPNTLANPATMAEPSPAVHAVGEPDAMEKWFKELDAAGVDIAIANGRYAAGLEELSMSNEELLDLQKKYPNRFLGLAALNLDQPMEKTVAELEDAISKGLRGANIEPGYRSKNGGATAIDNADFYPIFETMITADLP